MLTLESERLVLASRLPVPTVVPDRILLLGSERLVRRGTAATRTLASVGPDLAVRVGTGGGSGRAAGRRGSVGALVGASTDDRTGDAADHAVNHADRGTHGTGPRLILSICCERNRTNVTWISNPAGIPCGLPWVCRRSALLAQQNLNRRHQAGSRSFPSPRSSTSFHQRFPKSLPTMSYNLSPVFRSTAWSIGRPPPPQPPIQQKSLPPFDKSLLCPASEKSFSRILGRTFHHGASSIDIGGALGSIDWKLCLDWQARWPLHQASDASMSLCK